MSNQIEGFVALMGLDWATDKHDVQLLEVGTEKPRHLVLKHGAESIEKWVSHASASGRKVVSGNPDHPWQS